MSIVEFLLWVTLALQINVMYALEQILLVWARKTEVSPLHIEELDRGLLGLPPSGYF